MHIDFITSDGVMLVDDVCGLFLVFFAGLRKYSQEIRTILVEPLAQSGARLTVGGTRCRLLICPTISYRLS